MTKDEACKIALRHSELPVIIDGPHAPTGKSTLCEQLREEKEMTGIETATTKQLVEELINRGGARIVELGLYKPYEITSKYGAPDMSDFSFAILLDDLDS